VESQVVLQSAINQRSVGQLSAAWMWISMEPEFVSNQPWFPGPTVWRYNCSCAQCWLSQPSWAIAARQALQLAASLFYR
jgi:hypothetical protein